MPAKRLASHHRLSHPIALAGFTLALAGDSATPGGMATVPATERNIAQDLVRFREWRHRLWRHRPVVLSRTAR